MTSRGFVNAPPRAIVEFEPRRYTGATMGQEIPTYGEFYQLGGEAFRRFGDILDLPRREHLFTYASSLARGEFKGQRVLDFGCGVGKPLQSMLGLPEQLYATCDNDPAGSFTYRDLGDIPAGERFGLIVSNHTFEHFTVQEGQAVCRELARHLAPGGVLLIGVPNPKHPTRFMSDPTHRTPWSYLNLCALMTMSGVTPYLCARNHKHRPPLFLVRPVVTWLCRVFMMDWCDSIYVAGRREP